MRKNIALFSYGIFASILFFNALTGRAADVVWTNLAGGNWATASGWSPNQVPGAMDKAFITNAGTYTVTISTANAVSNLVVGLDAPGGQPVLSVQNTLTVGGGWDIGTNGVVDFIGTLNGAGSVTNRGLFNFYASVLQGTGQFINQVQGRIDSFGGGFRYLYRPLINFGEFNRDTAAAYIDSLGVITNQPGAVINIWTGGFGGGSSATNIIVNHGTINMLSVNSTLPSYLDAPLLNNGSLNVGVSNSGSIFYAMIFRGGTNTGTINVSPNGILFFIGGRFSLESGTQLLGTGTLVPNFSGELVFNTPLTSSHQIQSGNGGGGPPKIWINADLNSLNRLTIAQGQLYLTNPAITVNAKEFYFGTASAYITNSATINADLLQSDNGTFENAGTINVRSNFNFNGGSFFGYGAGTFNTLSNSITTLASAAGKNFYTTRWNNHGTVNFNIGGDLWFLGTHWVNEPGGVVNAGSSALIRNYDIGYTNSFVNFGLVQRSGIGSNPSFDLPTTNYGTVKLLDTIITLGKYTQLGGSTDIGGSTINGAKFNILGGELSGAAAVQSSPSLNNAATLRPGSPLGLLSLTGPFTNTTGGTYHMQIAQTNNYDRINVNSSVNLAGTLNVTFTNGFYPTIGNTFTALTYTARSGQFDQILTPNYEFEIIYTPTNLLLRASNALPVVNFSITGGNTQLVCNPFTLTATATDLDGSVTNLTFLLNGAPIATHAGGTFSTTFETDFPATNLFEARAWDDRGGTGSSNRTVASITLPLHTLTLGGGRTNGFKICMVGETGSNYLVFATTNISTPFATWTNLGLMENTNGIWRYYDAGTITNRPHRFYRAKQSP